MKSFADALNTSTLSSSISDIAKINMKDVMPTGMLSKTIQSQDLISSANAVGK